MKKILLLCAFVLSAGLAKAQIDATVNPVGLIFGYISLSGEYVINDNMGVELGVRFVNRKRSFGITIGDDTSSDVTEKGFGAGLTYKYYFAPDKGADKWYGFAYVRFESYSADNEQEILGTKFDYGYKSSVVAGGIGVGYKWVFDKGILIDINFGVGNPFSESRTYNTEGFDDSLVDIDFGIDFVSKLGVGYRFGG